MRTRRSPRNQERLWNELGMEGALPKPTPIKIIRTDKEIDEMWWISKTSRSLMKRNAQRARLRGKSERR